MFGESDPQIQISGRPAANAGFPASGQAESFAFGHAGRDFHLVLVGLGHAPAAAARAASATRPFPAAAQDAVDPFMGDWQGSVSISSRIQPVSVCMIPLGKGRYEARFVAWQLAESR